MGAANVCVEKRNTSLVIISLFRYRETAMAKVLEAAARCFERGGEGDVWGGGSG